MDGSSQILNVTLNDFAEIAKALSSDLRIEMFDIPPSTASANVRKSEEVGLIQTELVLGTRGTQKCCAAVLNRIIVETQEPEEREENCVITSMPIGHFFDFEVTPTCGLLRRWQVSSHGSFIEGRKISDVVLRELLVNGSPHIVVRLALDETRIMLAVSICLADCLEITGQTWRF